MAVPKRLQQEIEAAEAAEAAQSAPVTESVTEPVVTGDPVVAPVAAEPVVVAPVAQPVAAAVDPKEEARQKTYDGLLAKRQKELEESQSEIARLQKMLTDNMEKMAAFTAQATQIQAQTQPVVEPKPEEKPPLVAVQALTEEEDDILGGADGNLASAIRKLAVTEFSGLANTLESRIKAVEDALNAAIAGVQTKVETVVQSQEQRQKNEFMTKLLGRVQNAEQINNSPEFQEWLAKQFDGDFVKVPLWDVYGKALNVDADVVASIQERFLKAVGAGNGNGNGNGAVQPPVQEQPASAVVQPPIVPEALQDQIALPRSSGAGVPGEKPVQPITMEELEKLSAAARTLKTKAANDAFDAGYKKMEAQLIAQYAQR